MIITVRADILSKQYEGYANSKVSKYFYQASHITNCIHYIIIYIISFEMEVNIGLRESKIK